MEKINIYRLGACHCCECTHYNNKYGRCEYFNAKTDEYDFCSNSELKTVDNEYLPIEMERIDYFTN